MGCKFLACPKCQCLDEFLLGVSTANHQENFAYHPSLPGGSITTRAELRNPQSLPEITDGKYFGGCWDHLTFLFLESQC
jgi:hypothetical protein